MRLVLGLPRYPFAPNAFVKATDYAAGLSPELADRLETVAAIVHDEWVDWAQSLVAKESLSAERVERWQDLFVPYAELSEPMKDEDRRYAKKVLEAVDAPVNEITAANETTETDDDEPEYTTACVMLALSDEQLSAVRGAGADIPDDAHITLAFLGERAVLGQSKINLIKRVLTLLTQTLPPVAGETNGFGRFMNGDTDVLYLNYDAPDLPDLRAAVVKTLNAIGVQENREHGFTPHVTLEYVSQDKPTPKLRVRVPLEFTALELWVGDEHTVFPLNPNAPLLRLTALLGDGYDRD